jgi:hypothetical protein
MDPLTLALGAIKAYFEYLCTPEGQKFAAVGNDLFLKPLAAAIEKAIAGK